MKLFHSSHKIFICEIFLTVTNGHHHHHHWCYSPRPSPVLSIASLLYLYNIYIEKKNCDYGIRSPSVN
nr:MAG: hypothetical protein DiTV3a_F3ORF10 [Diabrotica toursvirus 3a]